MTSPFRVTVRDDGSASLVFDLPDSPVNLMSVEVLLELRELLAALTERADITRLVLLSGKPTGFVAGANLEEILAVEDPRIAADVSRLGQSVTHAFERLPFPTVSAIDGACMGGGTELSLAADHILVSDRPGLRIGLPEVRIGIVPGWGGCVRLPRRLGIAASLDLIVKGRSVDGARARRLGLADAVLPAAQFHREVAAWVGDLTPEVPPRPRAPARSRWENPLTRGWIFEQARRRTLAATDGRYPAPLRAIEVVRLGIEEGAEAGFEAEIRAISELATSRVCKNLIHVFHLTESAKRRFRKPTTAPPTPVAVLGAGAMGSSLALTLALHTDRPVRLVDVERAALEAAMARSARELARQVERGRISPVEARRRQALLRPALDPGDIEGCDRVLENVPERLEAKQEILAAAERTLPNAVFFATNTSALRVEEIGARLEDPSRLVGLHFFRPVERMALVEVVRSKGTSDATLEHAVGFVRELGKTPVLVRDRPGFLVNRILYFYLVEALWLLHEGYSVEEIDETIERWGMPMGPFAVLDEIGLDVALGVARLLGNHFEGRLPLPPWIDLLLATRRYGRKTEGGFYRYADGDRDGPDRDLVDHLDIRLRPEDHHSRAPLDRLTLRMVDEAARCLDEGVVDSADELDLAMLLGTGFPPFRGGLCRWADRQGPQQILDTLERVTAGCGERFRPSSALREVAARGAFRSR